MLYAAKTKVHREGGEGVDKERSVPDEKDERTDAYARDWAKASAASRRREGKSQEDRHDAQANQPLSANKTERIRQKQSRACGAVFVCFLR